jgi:predicted amidohydrolase
MLFVGGLRKAGGGFDFTVAELAIPGGCTPDTISSDIHVFSGNSPGVPYLPNVMSKFMLMGFSLEQVVTMTTTAPAKIINRAPKIGTLQTGAPADVAIMGLVEGPVSFLDTRNNKRDGKLLLKAGADGDQWRAVRPAVSVAVRGEVRACAWNPRADCFAASLLAMTENVA